MVYLIVIRYPARQGIAQRSHELMRFTKSAVGDKWSVSDGLPSPSIRCIVESAGFLRLCFFFAFTFLAISFDAMIPLLFMTPFNTFGVATVRCWWL